MSPVHTEDSGLYRLMRRFAAKGEPIEIAYWPDGRARRPPEPFDRLKAGRPTSSRQAVRQAHGRPFDRLKALSPSRGRGSPRTVRPTSDRPASGRCAILNSCRVPAEAVPLALVPRLQPSSAPKVPTTSLMRAPRVSARPRSSRRVARGDERRWASGPSRFLRDTQEPLTHRRLATNQKERSARRGE